VGCGPWKIALRAAAGEEERGADHAIVSDWIPVTPGGGFRLSGRVWRGEAADNVYLDFDDGRGQGGDFEDAQALAKGTGAWESVATVARVGPTTTGIRVRFVRDGSNRGDALCDALTLQRVD
jgi:hypothetical protein